MMWAALRESEVTPHRAHSQKSPKKEGATKVVPNRYQGVRLPQDVLVQSEHTPTSGVMRPSAICPESMTSLHIKEITP